MITCIVTHHTNSCDYLLRRCIRSLEADPCEKEILVISDSKEPPQGLGTAKLFHSPDCSMWEPDHKANFGVANASPNTLGYFMVNDDLVLLKGSLGNLVQEATHHEMILNPISNCEDINIINPQECGFKTEVTPPTEDPDDELGHLLDIVDGRPFIFPTHRLYTYATVIPKAIWDKVGPFDPKFGALGCIDEDYSLRASIAGVRLGILTNAFVLHYQHRSVMQESDRDPGAGLKVFVGKYGIMPPPPISAPGFGGYLYLGIRAMNELEMKRIHE